MFPLKDLEVVFDAGAKLRKALENFHADRRLPSSSSNLGEPPALSRNSGLVRPYVLFNGHIFELTRFKDVATFLAFNELSVFFAGDNAHAGMPAGFLHRWWFGRPFRDR
jgi:hypothetical protein